MVRIRFLVLAVVLGLFVGGYFDGGRGAEARPFRHAAEAVCHGSYVKWPSGAPIAHATVVLHDAQTGRNSFATTDAGGIWQFCVSSADTYVAQASVQDPNVPCIAYASSKVGPKKLIDIGSLVISQYVWAC